MTRTMGWRSVAALVLAAVGAAAMAQGAWIHAKARLGQALIGRAWREVQRGDGGARPWPWADTRPVARLQVPGLGVEEFVLSGGVGSTLAWGPGHLAGTAPVGGPGNAVVGGHRDTHFAFLRDLAPGTVIRVQTADEGADGAWHRYRVTERFVTDERDARVWAETDEPRLTLVTCWPFDALEAGGTRRYVVVAEGVEEGPAADGADPARARPRGRSPRRRATAVRVASRSSSATRGAAAARE